jgi:hypothetical protein
MMKIQPGLTAAFLLLVSILICSCSNTRGVDKADGLTAPEVISLVENRNARVAGMSGSGMISIDSPEFSNSGSIELKLLKPDSLLFELSGPFGVRVAKGLVTGKAFTLYNGLDNTVAEGATDMKTLKQVLRISIEFRRIMQILSGTMSIEADRAGSVPRGIREDNFYRILYTDKAETIEYLVDLSVESVKRYTRKTTDGQVIEDIYFKDFRKKSGIYLPTVITVERPPAEESLTLVYERQTLNDLPMDFTFKIPASATKIHF